MRRLELDNILSASDHFVTRWSTGLESNRARRLLRFVVCRLWDTGRGQLVGARLQLAQTTLAGRLTMSRQWVGVLASRLHQAGWLEHSSCRLPDGTNSSSIWQAGRLLKRLLVMLCKSRRGERPVKHAAKPAWLFSPSKERKEAFLYLEERLEKEKRPPTEEAFRKIPLLRIWLDRA